MLCVGSCSRHYQLFPSLGENQELGFSVCSLYTEQGRLHGSYQPNPWPLSPLGQVDSAGPVQTPGLVRQKLALWTSLEKLEGSHMDQLFSSPEGSWKLGFFICSLCVEQRKESTASTSPGHCQFSSWQLDYDRPVRTPGLASPQKKLDCWVHETTPWLHWVKLGVKESLPDGMVLG